jgi:dTMP kinase
LLKIRKPDMTLLFDLPAKIGLLRARGRNLREQTALGRFEAESLRFHRRVRKAYLEFALQEPKRFCIIPASGNPEAVHQRVLAHVMPLLA